MSIIPEPIPIPDESQNPEFFYLNQLRDIVAAARNLTLTTRDGAIQNYDKAGNLNAQFVVFTSNGTANTEDTVLHTLGRVPVGYIPVEQDKAASLYDGGTTWTTTAIYFKTSVATVAWKVLIF